MQIPTEGQGEVNLPCLPSSEGMLRLPSLGPHLEQSLCQKSSQRRGIYFMVTAVTPGSGSVQSLNTLFTFLWENPVFSSELKSKTLL